MGEFYMIDLYKKGMKYYLIDDYKKAIKFFEEGKEKNDIRCIIMYGYCLYKGYGIENKHEQGKTLIISYFPKLIKEADGKDNGADVLLFKC